MQVPTKEDSVALIETPSLEEIDAAAANMRRSLDVRLSENALLRHALEVIKETSYDSEAVQIAERALE